MGPDLSSGQADLRVAEDVALQGVSGSDPKVGGILQDILRRC